MPFMGGAGKDNYIPKGNKSPGSRGNTAPGGGNSTPKGRGNGSAISGRGGTRGIDSSFTRQQQAARQTKGYLTKSGQVAPHAGRNYQKSLNNIANKRLPKSSIIKGLGKTSGASGTSQVISKAPRAGISKFFLKTAGKASLWAYVFLSILLEDQGLESGTLPEHLRNPGERQQTGIKQGETIPPQSLEPEGIRRDLYVTWRPFVGSSDVGLSTTVNKPVYALYGTYNPIGNNRGVMQMFAKFSESGVFEKINEGLATLGNQPVKPYETYINLPFENKTYRPTEIEPEPIISESTIDLSRIPNPEPATDSNIPQPSMRYIISVPKNIKPSPVPRTLPSLPSPSVFPLPIPELPKTPEKTIEEKEQEERDRETKQPEKPKYFSEEVTRRADGTKETRKQREATEEELRDINRKFNNAKKINQEYKDYRDFNSEDGRAPVITSDPVPIQNSNPPNIVEEIIKKPPSEIDKEKLRPPIIEDDGNKDNNPPPLPPVFPPIIPPPVNQTPPDKCKGTCAGKNGAKLDQLNAWLGGTGVVQNQGLLGIVRDTNNVINDPVFGLKRVQEFAQTAWKVTRADKILNYLSMAATLHNAAMLSRNLGASLGDTISSIANNTISAIKNEESSPIDINATLGSSLENFIKGVIGAENYAEGGETFNKYSRAVNAASNMIYSVTAINAGLAQGLETIGNYTGQIGNALKKSGAVLENSYQYMSEKVSVKTGRLGQIQSLIDGGEKVEDLLSQIDNTTQEFREIQEETGNIGREFGIVKDTFEKEEKDKKKVEDIAKARSQAAQPELTDLTRDPLGE